jgi:hypothetical protein
VSASTRRCQQADTIARHATASLANAMLNNYKQSNRVIAIARTRANARVRPRIGLSRCNQQECLKTGVGCKIQRSNKWEDQEKVARRNAQWSLTRSILGNVNATAHTHMHVWPRIGPQRCGHQECFKMKWLQDATTIIFKG